jgi:hypothetical protein
MRWSKANLDVGADDNTNVDSLAKHEHFTLEPYWQPPHLPYMAVELIQEFAYHLLPTRRSTGR